MAEPAQAEIDEDSEANARMDGDATPTPTGSEIHGMSIGDYEAAKAAFLAQDTGEQEEEEEPESEVGEPTAEDGAEEEDQEEGEPESGKTQTRFRIQATDALDAEVLSMKKRNPDLSLSECLTRVEKAKGITRADQPEQDATNPASEPKPEIESSEAIAAKIAATRAARKKALAEDLDFEAVATLDEELYDLEQRRVTASRLEAETETQAEREFDRTVDDSKAKALSLYPDCSNPESDLSRQMAEIDATLRETGNPLYYSADKPLVVAQMAANVLRIAPATGKPTAQRSAPPARSSAPKPPLASGSRRTAPVDSAANARKLIESIESPDDYQRLLARAGLVPA